MASASCAGRNRRFFKDKAEAKAFMRLAEVQQENYGTAALSFSDTLRVETVECSEWLQPYGKTLRDATKFYLAHLKAVTGSRKVREVVADLLAARGADGMSTRYLGDLRVRLGRFVNSFGDEMIAAINARQIDEWLRGLGVGAVTRNTFRRRLAALFSFAKRRGYVTENPVADVERAKEREPEIEILSVSEIARITAPSTKAAICIYLIAFQNKNLLRFPPLNQKSKRTWFEQTWKYLLRIGFLPEKIPTWAQLGKSAVQKDQTKWAVKRGMPRVTEGMKRDDMRAEIKRRIWIAFDTIIAGTSESE